jgi:6-phosphogluconolactonase
MGGEGHVASLFPDTEALGETQRLVTAFFVPALGRRRMTFTYPLINAARHVLLLVTGGDKAHAVNMLVGDQEPPRGSLPAAGIALGHGELTLVLDEAAAKLAGLRSQH